MYHQDSAVDADTDPLGWQDKRSIIDLYVVGQSQVVHGGRDTASLVVVTTAGVCQRMLMMWIVTFGNF